MQQSSKLLHNSFQGEFQSRIIFHEALRHSDRNNFMSDTNVEICQQTTFMSSNENTICPWLRRDVIPPTAQAASKRQKKHVLIFKIEGWVWGFHWQSNQIMMFSSTTFNFLAVDSLDSQWILEMLLAYHHSSAFFLSLCCCLLTPQQNSCSFCWTMVRHLKFWFG